MVGKWNRKGEEQNKPAKVKQPTREELEKQLEDLKKEVGSDEPEEGTEPEETNKADAPNRSEIVDMINGNLARASELLRYLG